MNFFMVNPDDLPEGLREELQRQHDLHHMGHVQAIHEARDFLHSLTREQMVTLRNMISGIVEGTVEDNERGAYALGKITEILDIRHGVCGCGVDHDKEAETFLTPDTGHKPMPKTLDEALQMKVDNTVKKRMPFEEAKKFLEEGIHEMAAGGNWTIGETNAAIENGIRMLGLVWPDQAEEEKPEPKEKPITFTDHDGLTHVWEDGAWVREEVTGEPVTVDPPAGPPREALLKEYGVLDVPLQFPKVICAKDCGTTWISLADRMRRAPDGCGGCQNRAAWG